MKNPNSTKRCLVVKILAGLLFVGLITTTVLLFVNHSQLKNDYQKRLDEQDERIESLESDMQVAHRYIKELQSNDPSFGPPENAETIDLTDVISNFLSPQNNQVAPAETLPGTISESELLENYFTDPIMVEPGVAGAGTQASSEGIVLNGPILNANPDVVDFGSISKQNGSVSNSIELKNEGSEDLRISYTLSSCGCTAGNIEEPITLAPGETYDLEISYDPNYYGPGLGEGHIEKTITIISNSVGSMFYRVNVVANVTP